MKKTMITIAGILILFSAIMQNSFAQKEAPTSLAAALVMKLAGFNSKIKGDVSIYVIGSNALADELKKGIGKNIGGGVLKEVKSGDDVPSSKPSIVFIANAGKAGAAVGYCKKNKVMSVTNIPTLASKGVSLSIGVGDDGKPKIILNVTASADEGADWNQAIMKVAETIK